MELWCEGSEEGLLEEDLDVSLVAGVGVHLGKVLDLPCSFLGDCWTSLYSCLGEGLGLFVQLHANRHQASLPDDAFDPPSHGAAKA